MSVVVSEALIYYSFVSEWNFVKLTPTIRCLQFMETRACWKARTKGITTVRHAYRLLIAARARCPLSDLLFHTMSTKACLCLFSGNREMWEQCNILICGPGADWGQSVICCFGPGDRLWYHQRASSFSSLRIFISSNSSSLPPARTSYQVHGVDIVCFPHTAENKRDDLPSGLQMIYSLPSPAAQKWLTLC